MEALASVWVTAVRASFSISAFTSFSISPDANCATIGANIESTRLSPGVMTLGSRLELSTPMEKIRDLSTTSPDGATVSATFAVKGVAV